MKAPLPRVSLALLGLLVACAVLVPWLSPHDYFTPDWNNTELPPQWAGGHLLGTDELGRDLLVRLMWSGLPYRENHWRRHAAYANTR